MVDRSRRRFGPWRLSEDGMTWVYSESTEAIPDVSYVPSKVLTEIAHLGIEKGNSHDNKIQAYD
jgi:hypothetical protein